MESREDICAAIDAYLNAFGNSWNLQILYQLYTGPKRFNELKRELKPITQAVLTRHLRSMEECEIIDRTIQGKNVIYSISKSGYSIVPSMISTYYWLMEHHPDLKPQKV